MNLNFPLLLTNWSSKQLIDSKKWCLLIVIIISFNSLKAQKISYTYQNISIEHVQQNSIDWQKFDKQIYNGTNNGIYWFKIELNNNIPQVLNIPESHISRANLYYLGKEILKETDTRFVTFNIKTIHKATYYLKVNCLLEARIPLKIQDYDSFYKCEMKNYIVIGIYIGFILSIILFNLLSYFTLKNNTYLYYIFMVIGMAVNAFYKDGLTALIFGIEGINETHEVTLTSIVVISAIFFSTSYLSLNKHLPKLKKAGIIVVCLGIILNITYQITSNFTLFIFTNIVYLLALDIFWFASILLWKKSIDARFFALAYGIPLFFVHDYYISPHLGSNFLNLPLYFYKIGSVFEMIVFTYAIMYQSKRLSEENKTIRKKLMEYTQALKQQNLDINTKNISSDKLIEQFGFTIREIEILKKVASNKINKEIAAELFISENTVKFHIRNILQKFEVKNRKAASNKYLQFEKRKTQ